MAEPVRDNKEKDPVAAKKDKKDKKKEDDLVAGVSNLRASKISNSRTGLTLWWLAWWVTTSQIPS
jgi:hypothetical protein